MAAECDNVGSGSRISSLSVGNKMSWHWINGKDYFSEGGQAGPTTWSVALEITFFHVFIYFDFVAL